MGTRNLSPIRLNLGSKSKIVFLLHVYLIIGASVINIFEMCMKFGKFACMIMYVYNIFVELRKFLCMYFKIYVYIDKNMYMVLVST